MSAKLENIIEQLKTLTLLEAADLVKEIENTFGVDTSVSVVTSGMMPIGTGSDGNSGTGAAEEEKDAFDITLVEVPADKKIAILKIVRTITGLGLKESKEIVDNVPKLLKEGVTKEDSEKIKKELEAAGGKITIG